MANKRKSVVESTAPVAEQTTQRRAYRAGITGKRNKLTVRGKEPGFVYRVVNDDEDRILDLQERGYELVTHKVAVGDKRVATPVAEGSPIQISVGQGKKAFLMRTKKEWYDEDQRAKAAEVDALDRVLNGIQDADYGKVKLEQRTDGQAKPDDSYELRK